LGLRIGDFGLRGEDLTIHQKCGMLKDQSLCRRQDWRTASENVQRFIDFADPKRNPRGNSDTPQAAVYVEGIGDVSDLVYEGSNQRSDLQRENVQRRREGRTLQDPGWIMRFDLCVFVASNRTCSSYRQISGFYEGNDFREP